MSSRRYPDKLTFERRTVTTAASGQGVESWEPVFVSWGRVVQTAAGESVSNDQLQSHEGYTIDVPYHAAAAAVVALEYRVLWRNRQGVEITLNLTAVDLSPAGRSPELTFKAAR